MNARAQREWDGDWGTPPPQLHPVMVAALAPWAPKTTKPRVTSSDLYCMGMESDTAYRLMPQLCEACGIAFPPELDNTNQARRDALPDPLNPSPLRDNGLGLTPLKSTNPRN